MGIWFLKYGTETALALSVLFDSKLMSTGIESGGYWAGRSVVFKTPAIDSGGPRLNKGCVNLDSAQVSSVVALFSQDTIRGYAGYGTLSHSLRGCLEHYSHSILRGSEPMYNGNARVNDPCPIRFLWVFSCHRALTSP